MVHVEVVVTDELGDRSYVAHDDRVAVVVDPQRDIDRVEKLLDRLGLSCELVLETHIHNDYVSGGHQLAKVTGARYAVSAHDEVEFERVAVHDRDELTVGSMTIQVVATPGHTDHHLSYVISDGDGPPAVFSGGCLLYGSVGRTDLVDPARTEQLAHAQYRSARRLADLLPAEAGVFPTHGFGSFCSAGSTGDGPQGTLADELTGNDALTEPDEDRFVEKLVAGLTAYPAYYAHMGARNRDGAGPVDLSPPEHVDPDRLRDRIDAGEWVVDLRDRTAYAADHVAGTIGIALGTQFATWLGWLIPWGTPLTLIGQSAEQVADAQRQLVRIGIDRPSGHAVGEPADLAPRERRRSYPVVSFTALARRDPADGVVLDVRRDDEWAAAHIPDAVHIPLHDLLHRIEDVPDAPLWVHCAAGYRASIAAGLLDRVGHDVRCVDDEFAHAEELGLVEAAR
nr:MBL fold metallo-hydrolase [Kibdelosporangium sp. MJ126-NF4]CEL13193.1 Metallo-beta-lactamase family protein [Kibdelosporangium sp. MJ126-NF4]CTQ98883.1 Metallo-beta-lactamase family protein [Kibdelosporangium sp. MJ126-NF4]